MAKEKKDTGVEVAAPQVGLMVSPDAYAITGSDIGGVVQVIKNNLGGETIGPRDLTQVKVPTTGTVTFAVTDINGEETQEKELVGILTLSKLARAYWPGKYVGGNEPPQCSATGGGRGVGNPGGVCALCPMAEFESAVDGAGQACKQMDMIFLLQKGNVLPTLVVLPATSLKQAREYKVALSTRGLSYYQVETAIRLVKATSKGGIVYTQTQLRFVRVLTLEEAQASEAYHNSIAGMLGELDLGRDGDVATSE